jgi:glycosyltransferase involved in cell wall biosynthesis
MNILLITYQGDITGSTNSIAYLARELARRGHGVYVAGRQGSMLFSLLQNSDVRLIPMTFRKKFDLDTARQIRDAVRRYHIDIINAQSSKDRYGAIFARWLYRLPVVVIHTRRQPPLSAGGFLQRRFYELGTDAIVVISDQLKKTFIKKGFSPAHLHVIYNGSPSIRYQQADPGTTTRLRTQLGIKKDEIVIGCVSRLKHQRQILAAARNLAPSITLLFVGIEKHCLDSDAARLGLKNRLFYAGIVDPDEVLNYYPLLSVNVLASTTEGFGLVLVEAMAMGVPVIGTRAQGIMDVVEEGVNGLLFDNGNIDELTDCLKKILYDSEKRDRCIQGGYETAFNKFSIEKTGENYERLFQSLLAAR